MLLKYLTKIFIIVVISIISLLPLSSMLYAQEEEIVYTSISLSPSSGTISTESTAIQVNVNSGTSNFVGYDITISLSGPIEYVSSTEESVCNSYFEVTSDADSVEVVCLSSLDDTHIGSTATLYFRAVDTGTAILDISNTDTSITISSLSGGTYTMSGGTTDDPSDDTDTSLPRSGIFDDSPVILLSGFILIFVGGVFLLTKPGLFRKWKGTVVIYDD